MPFKKEKKNSLIKVNIHVFLEHATLYIQKLWQVIIRD